LAQALNMLPGALAERISALYVSPLTQPATIEQVLNAKLGTGTDTVRSVFDTNKVVQIGNDKVDDVKARSSM
jgi:hypothetical protein